MKSLIQMALTLAVFFGSPIAFAAEDVNLYSDYQNYIDGMVYPEGLLAEGPNGTEILYDEDPESEYRKQLRQVPLHQQEIIHFSANDLLSFSNQYEITKEYGILAGSFSDFVQNLKQNSIFSYINTVHYLKRFNQILKENLKEIEKQNSHKGIDLNQALIACDEAWDTTYAEALHNYQSAQGIMISAPIEDNGITYYCEKIKESDTLNRLQVVSVATDTGEKKVLHSLLSAPSLEENKKHYRANAVVGIDYKYENLDQNINFILSPDKTTMIITEEKSFGLRRFPESTLYLLTLATQKKYLIHNTRSLYNESIWRNLEKVEYGDPTTFYIGKYKPAKYSISNGGAPSYQQV